MTVDKSDERVRAMFGQIAPRYDRMNHLLSMQVDRYWRWKTVRLVPPQGDAPILDVCCGTGDLALAFHRATRGLDQRSTVMPQLLVEVVLRLFFELLNYFWSHHTPNLVP